MPTEKLKRKSSEGKKGKRKEEEKRPPVPWNWPNSPAKELRPRHQVNQVKTNRPEANQTNMTKPTRDPRGGPCFGRVSLLGHSADFY